MSEHSLINKYFAPLAASFGGAAGLLNDGAVLGVVDGKQLVVTTDTLNEGVHFLGTEPPELLAQKALRVNLSDLAAMGATPFAYTLNLSLPRHLENWTPACAGDMESVCTDDSNFLRRQESSKNTGIEGFLSAFCKGLAADQAQYGIALCGGDTTMSEHSLTITITAFGLAPRTILRSGAQAGDVVFVTGTLGRAVLGLQALKENPVIDLNSPLQRAYLLPEPRVALSALIADYATAAADISDGLLADVGHIANASGVEIVLETARLPVAEMPWEQAITGGDDYELVCTISVHRAAEFIQKVENFHVTLTNVGYCQKGRGVTLRGKEGNILPLPATTGYSHF
jgi:thiamine-monophosphate kinase